MKLSVFKQLIKEAIREELQSELKQMERRILKEMRQGNKIEHISPTPSIPTPAPVNKIDTEQKSALREMFLQKMGGPLGEIMSETVNKIDFTSEDLFEEDSAPSVLDGPLNFLNKDYSSTLKAMENSQKQRNNS